MAPLVGQLVSFPNCFALAAIAIAGNWFRWPLLFVVCISIENL